MWRNPVVWFSDLPWVIRALVILTLVPLISVSAIGWYSLQQWHSTSPLQQLRLELLQTTQKTQSQLSDNHLTLLKEIAELRKDVATLNKKLATQKIDDELIAQVLGSTVPLPSAFLLVELISPDNEAIKIYDQPDDTVPVAITMHPSTILSLVSRKSGWVEIDIHQEKTGWVKEQNVKEL